MSSNPPQPNRWFPYGKTPAVSDEGLIGGAKRSRTADLLNAIQALYQLSYSPGENLAPGLAEARTAPARGGGN
jgi:hypothetical protein